MSDYELDFCEETRVCTSNPDWHDIFSKSKNCEYFEIPGNFCGKMFGVDYFNWKGETAREECCACGGGERKSIVNGTELPDFTCKYTPPNSARDKMDGKSATNKSTTLPSCGLQ